MTRTGRLALWLLAGLVTVPTVTAFVESYNGLYGWALDHKLDGAWARAWPLQVDAFIAAGETALFLAALYLWPRRIRVIAWSVSLIGLAVSVTCNAGHVGKDATVSDHLTAALPPLAAMGGLVIALAVVKRVAHMWRQMPTTTGQLGPAGPVWVPATEPARAALLVAVTHDLRSAVSDAVDAVTDLVNAVGAVLGDPGPVAPLAEVRWKSGSPELPESDPRERSHSLELDRVRLANLTTDADRIRHAIGVLGSGVSPTDLDTWLSDRGQRIARENIRSTLRRVRSQQVADGMSGKTVDSSARQHIMGNTDLSVPSGQGARLHPDTLPATAVTTMKGPQTA
jgi:hypothetical protein